MGMGEDPCGSGACGLDVQNFSALPRPNAPAALAFDGRVRDYRLDANGRYVGAHPVDAKVFLLCRTALGSIRSAPELGQTVKRIGSIDKQKIRAQVEDAFRVVLAPVVAAGEIRLDSIDFELEAHGRVMARPNYVNLITARPRPKNFPFV